MEIYTDNEIKLMLDNMNNILKEIKKKVNTTLEPTVSEINKIADVVLKYVKNNKLIIYGGTSLDMALKYKKDSGLYDEYDMPDIDFYADEPLKHMKALCDILYKEYGYKEVQAKEAGHPGTYKIFVNFKDISDITYVPINIYKTIPFIDIDGYRVVHPTFALIDYYRMLSDPLISSVRWEKAVKRILLIQKYWTLHKISKELYFSQTKYPDIRKYIFKDAHDKPSLLIVGYEAYNQMILYSRDEKIKPINVPYLEIMSTNYVEDAQYILQTIRGKIEDQNKLEIVEYFPFFQFYGYNIKVLYDGNILLHMFDHNNLCMPYVETKTTHGILRIASYDMQIKYNLIMHFRKKVENRKSKIKNDDYYAMASQLIELKKYYFRKNKQKNILSNTLFKSFVIDCVGLTSDPKRDKILKLKQKHEKGKYPFKYEPSVVKKDNNIKYIFPNMSGNEINNAGCLKVTKQLSR